MKNNIAEECFDCKDIDLELSGLIDFLKILSEQNRLKIICFIKNKEKCVCEIQNFLNIPQNLVSHHLKIMKDFNLLKFKRIGLRVFYSLDKDFIEKYSLLLNNFLNIKEINMEIKIKVLGSGCPKCKKLYELTQEVVKELDFEIDVEYISDISEIIAIGVMSSPALVINDIPVLVGVLPDKGELKKIIEKSVKDNFKFKDCGCDGSSDSLIDDSLEKADQCGCEGNC